MNIKNFIKHLIPVSRRKFDVAISHRDEKIAECDRKILDLENYVEKLTEQFEQLSEFSARLDVKMTDVLKISVKGAEK
ncbi:hypothetical protein [Treponema zioleckii]|uniref:hypothetical protein n=1 Tax=Treponema zioleckii TaxID=331680 RepID=UPI00168AD060|nr:hypothetical protein [Treponema zioleckii]